MLSNQISVVFHVQVICSNEEDNHLSYVGERRGENLENIIHSFIEYYDSQFPPEECEEELLYKVVEEYENVFGMKVYSVLLY